MPEIILTTLNAKYAHSAFGLRYLMANLGNLQARAKILEFDISQKSTDIVEAILDGRQPSDLTFQKLTNKLPLSWVAQRELLGFPELRQKPISRVFN